MDYFDEVSELNDVLRTIYSAEAKEFPQVLDALTRAAARCRHARHGRRPGME